MRFILIRDVCNTTHNSAIQPTRKLRQSRKENVGFLYLVVQWYIPIIFT